MRAAIAMTAAAVLVLGAPIAAAEPTPVAPPELPLDPARILFIGNPAIVDPHPMTVESWSRKGDGLVVNFTTGTPECSGVHATVQETADSVTVDLRGGQPPSSFGRACILIAVAGVVDVPLHSPLGDRHVLSLT
jgi:hypothetical protein